MKPFIILSFALLSAIAANGQTDSKESKEETTTATKTSFRLDWDAAPKLHKLPDTFRKYSAAVALDQLQLQYKQEGDAIYVYRTVHRVFRMYDDKGVESFNTLTIRVGGNRSVERLKARTITPEGKVIKVAQDKIKVSKGEDGVPQYLVAFEGVEKGAEVEYFYTEKRPLSVFGTESVQWSVPVMKSEITFVVPEKMKFDFKGYNNFPKPKDDSMTDGKRIYYVNYGPIAPLEQEEYSNYVASLMRLDYKLSYLSDNEFTRLFTWDDLAKRLYQGFYDISSKEEKTISKYLKSIGVTDDMDELQKVRRIEEAVKSSIVLSTDVSDEEYSKFEVIIQKKLTTESGMIRFMIACLEGAGIRNQLGLTSNYAEHPVDETFENWNALDNYLIYLPKEKGFLTPADPYTRFPLVPAALIYNKGI